MPTDFPDGTSYTILLVEAGEPVPWTKPIDLPYDPEKPLPKLGGMFGGESYVVMCDGTVRRLKRQADESQVKLTIMPNDGQPHSSHIFVQ